MINEIANLPEVSFIDAKTLDEVQAQMVAAYEYKYKEIKKKDLRLSHCAADPSSF